MRPGRFALSLILLASGAVVAAQPAEDAAHRADRLRTRALNARSATGYARQGASVGAGDESDYEQARAEYRWRLDAWRRRVAACNAGYHDACGG